MNHAARRAFTRYGLEMTEQDQAEIAFAIQAGEGKRLTRSPTAQVWAVQWKRAERIVPVVYHVKGKYIVTVLPACELHRTARYHELDVDWIEDNDNEPAFDAEGLADKPLAPFGPCPNHVLAERLREALNQ